MGSHYRITYPWSKTRRRTERWNPRLPKTNAHWPTLSIEHAYDCGGLNAERSTVLIVSAGLPGSGKTKLALRLSKVIGAVFLRIDSIEQALGIATAPSGEIGEAGYRVGYAIARDNLCAGRSVVADSVNPLQATRDTWRAVGDDAGVNVVEVELMCSDSAEHSIASSHARPTSPAWSSPRGRRL